MPRVALRAGLVALGAVLISIVIGSVVFPGEYYGLVDGSALLMCVLCPLLIAFPASYHNLWQRDRLHVALEELKRTHGELAQAHQKLAEKARRDDMTGMLNREAFFEEMDCARRAFGRGTLLILDAANFKQVHDNWGHLSGDAALLEIAAAIGRAVRGEDIVGRIGGEEFAVFLTDAGQQESLVAAERLRAEVAAIAFSPRAGERVALSVSIGGAMHRASAQLSDLMREADRRLYEAKRRGRNRVVFTGIGLVA
jgi:diguanylate cyclase (GGDEF)-like protein